ncbi:SDR family oxidoreductase [Pusillibacter faecalis]|nr:SDR family oxidoreductase [Pusillibacter faecalis]MBS5657396.1 SDR family oxidoreductase [Oscillibacter sp.]
MMQADFTGKVAVVTGGSGALCSEFCKALARSGAKVAVVGSRKETADGIAAEIIADGGEAIAVGCNVLDMDSVLAAEQVIRKAYGQYQILINGAGIAPAAACTTRERASMELLDASTTQENTLFNLDTEAVASVLDLNCLGIFNVTKVFAKRMAGVEGACIVNIASMSGLSPLTKQIAYSASKAAVCNLTQWLATYLADVGIRVNAIAPGFFATKINRRLLFNEDGSYTERSKKIISGTPMDRFGEPKELVGAMLYLCDHTASGFVTGVILPVDGGFSAYCGV